MKKILLGAAAASVMATGASAADVPVGSVAGVTGPIAEIIAEVVKGRELAAAQVNAQGGLFGGDTMKLTLGDSACDPKAAVDAGNKVVNVDQVVAIVGPNCSGATNAMTQSVTIPAGVVVVSESATAPSITTLDDNDTVFRTAPSDAYQGVALAKLVLDRGYKKVALSWANDDYNAGLGEEFKKAYTSHGGEIVAEQVHEPNKASYRSEVATLGSAGGDALVLFAYYGSSGITIIKNALETGAFDTFIGADGMINEETITQIGADNLKTSMFTQASSDNSTDAWARYEKAATDAGVQAAAPYVANGYDATFLMALAIEQAGAADRSKISAALRKVANAPGEKVLPGEWAKAKELIANGADIDYVGATGDIEFDENGDVAGVYAVYTAQADGTWKTELLK